MKRYKVKKITSKGNSFLLSLIAIFFVLFVPLFPSHSQELTFALYEGDLIRPENSHKVYIISEGKRRWIRDINVFNAYNFKWEDVKIVDPVIAALFDLVTLVRQQGDAKVYLLNESGFKRHIPSPQVFESYGFDWNDVVTVPSVEIASYPASRLMRKQGDTKVYYIQNNTKRWINAIEAFTFHNFDWNEVQVVNDTEAIFFTEGETITEKSPTPVPLPEEPIVPDKELTEEPKKEEAEKKEIIIEIPTATTTAPAAEPEAGAPAPSGGGVGAPPPAPSDGAPQPPPPTTSPCPFSSTGSQSYNVSSSNEPKISGLTVDPFDVQPGGTQAVTVTVADANGNSVTGVAGSVETDNGSTPFTLSLSSGTDTSGTWQGSWSSSDTLCVNYTVSVTATSASGVSTVDASFR